MDTQEIINYQRIEDAINYIKLNFKEQPNLDEVAEKVNLSPFHFQRLFTEWAGISPKKFLQYLSLDYAKGICYMAFADDQQSAFNCLQVQFPNAIFTQMVDVQQQNALFIFTKDWSQLSNIKLHLKGTSFQLKVWEALLNIPMGGLSTYGSIASTIQQPNASRAVGSAVGDNPVAFLIPCHRVIKSTGEFGQYHWGATRKSAIIGWEAAKVSLVD